MQSFCELDIPQDWRALLGDYLQSSDWQVLQENIAKIIQDGTGLICPEPQNFFKALSLTSVANVKVVILGQDPYHSPGLAQGLAFSIPTNIPTNSREFPSSLRNISKALVLENFGALPNGDLQHWAKQGVLLLNTALSVKLGEAASHTNIGWKTLIDSLITNLAKQQPNLVWMLWGGHAQSKLPLIELGVEQLTLQASHPSGLGVYKTAQPFLKPGATDSCRHFTKANEWLSKHGQTPISWVPEVGVETTQTIQAKLFN